MNNYYLNATDPTDLYLSDAAGNYLFDFTRSSSELVALIRADLQEHFLYDAERARLEALEVVRHLQTIG